MTDQIKKIQQRVDEIFAEVIALRRQLHQHPELSEHEVQTSQTIGQQLTAMGIPFTANVAGHGISALISGRDNSRAVGIRADIDALPITEAVDSPYRSQTPGVMHACGHDIHTAILLGTAKILNEMRDELPCAVRLLFQPAEETIGGARRMIEAGCLNQPPVHSVIGLHVEPDLPVGQVQIIPGSMNAASTEFHVCVKGFSCHGAHPYSGIDPLLPACAMVTNLQSIITRRLPATDSALITVGQFHSGTKNNIIPQETKFSGIIRTLDNDQRPFLKELLAQTCNHTAAAYGAECEINFIDSYPALVNDDELLQWLKPVFVAALGEDAVKISATPSLGADDFAYFCHGSRGLYYNIGVCTPGETPYSIHCDLFNPDEGCIRVGILTEVLAVLKIMEEEQ